jgi:uncharacterized membrane protein YkoI
MKVLTLVLALAGLGIPMTAGANTINNIHYAGQMAPAMAAPAYGRANVTRYQAVQIALRAVGGGTVTQVQFESDYPQRWQIEIAQPTTQYEVNVSARTGHVLSIIRQSDN